MEKSGPSKAYYHRPTGYSISIANPSMLAVGDVFSTDRIPDQLKLDGPISHTNNESSISVWYHTSTDAQVPAHDLSTVGSGLLGT